VGTERSMRYQNLGPGSYAFRIMARNSDGVWSEKDAAFSFSIAPRFYEAVWFYALIALIAALALWVFSIGRMRLAQQRFAAVLAERTRIARELHDTLMQDFMSIIWQLQAVAESREKTSGGIKERLTPIIRRAQAYLTETRLSLMDLRGVSLEHHDLKSALEGLTTRITEGAPLQTELQVKGDGAPIPTETENQLLRIAQEAVHNVVKHAHARHVAIDLTREPLRVVLRVRDDGCGFENDAPAEAGCFGLLGMRERAEQIGGHLYIESVPGEGTEIRVEAPLNG
jgi:signal transduction histidine kinase